MHTVGAHRIVLVHASTQQSTSGDNGRDVLYTQAVSTPTLDLSSAVLKAVACPAGRIAGP